MHRPRRVISFAVSVIAFAYFLIQENIAPGFSAFWDQWWGIGLVFGVAVIYTIYLESLNGEVQAMEIPEAKFRFTDDRIGIESGHSWTELSWKMIERYGSILKFVGLYCKAGYVTYRRQILIGVTANLLLEGSVRVWGNGNLTAACTRPRLSAPPSLAFPYRR